MATVDNVGILQLKLYHMESIKKFPRGISDQVISKSERDGESERAPGPGNKLDVPAPAGPSVKPQASSSKQQATESQASSDKHQA